MKNISFSQRKEGVGICSSGVYLGDHVGHLFERHVEAVGGVILIAIGLRILIGDLW